MALSVISIREERAAYRCTSINTLKEKKANYAKQ